MPQEKEIPTKPDFFNRLLLPLTFLIMLLVSWRRWTSLLVDTGREMDLPLRLLRGELLYRDIHFLYPPLSPYFNALLYKIFGARLAVLNIEGVICALIIVALCFAIARKILPEREAILASLAVVVWCIFKPEGNLISPYSFSALHGMILALATLWVTLWYGMRSGSDLVAASPDRYRSPYRTIVAVGILIGLAGITKQEFALTAAVTWSAGVLFLHRNDWRKLLGRLLVPAGISLLIVLPVYGYFLSRVGWYTLIEDCHLLYTKIPQSLVFYNSARTGLDHPFASILQMIGGAAVAIALAAVIVSISLAKSASRKFLQNCALVFSACIAIALFVVFVSHGRWDGSPLRALPFALVGLMLLHFFRKDETKPQFALFVIATYSLMALIRVALRVPSGGAFGGYFLPTSLILLVYLTVIALPQFVQARIHRRDAQFAAKMIISARIKLIGISLLSVWLVITIFVFGYRYRKTFPVLLEAPHGSLYVTKETAQAAQELFDFLRENAVPEDAVAVVPEGSSLAFLSGHRMPLRHQILIPDFMDAAEEQRAIEALRQAKFVCVVNRPMREFGLEAFGRDYYQAMGRELTDNFKVVKVCGEVKDENIQIGNPKFFIKILARK